MKRTRKILNVISNVIYPRRCAFCDGILNSKEPYICRKCAEKVRFIEGRTCVTCGTIMKSMYENVCPECQNSRHIFDEGFSPFAYEGDIRESIARYKYRGRAEYASFYAACIWKYGQMRIEAWNAEAIIPVPVHSSRLRERGYNQAFLLGKELSALSGIPLIDSLIVRKKKTIAQKALSGAERRKNLAEAFAFNGKGTIPESVIIVDDIFTTGSTVDALSYILRLNGVKYIYVVTIAIS